VTTPAVRHPGELRWETRLLAVLTLVLVSLGIAVCYAAGSYRDDWYAETQQQLSGAVIGGLLFLLAAGIDYRLLRKWARPMFYATIAGLALIAFVAIVWRGKRAPGAIGDFVPFINGSRRWLSLFGFQVQLSEIARFTVPVMVAALVADMGTRIRKFREGFIPVVMPIVIAAGLVAVQPNLSMAILLTCLTMSVVFVAGARIPHLLLLATIGLAGGATMLTLNAERSSRMDEYLAPALTCDIESQVCNSLIGLGNGGVFGVGSAKAPRSSDDSRTGTPTSSCRCWERSGGSLAWCSWCSASSSSAGWGSASQRLLRTCSAPHSPVG
jgi:cell division protein FtsW